MSVLKLYDTYTREIREFKAINANEVGLYACGPTVYDYAHIGNLRTYIFEDILRRTLEYNGYNVKHVMNITDVGHLTSDADSGEDKMEKGARKSGKTAWQIAQIYTEAFKQDLQLLNIKSPTIWCKATDHINEQIADIEKIEQAGMTYQTSDGVYFDTSKLDDYGYLARLDKAGLEQGARVDIGEKRNATDFALWKFSPKEQQRQMEWDSPWGRGFPGWHIECSAMAVKYLGQLFDIHCGGKDHIPVHHANEIAQSQACHNTILANYWLHGYFLELDNAKMSKSAGDFLRMQTLIDKGYDPLAYRFLCLTAHYRSDLKFTWETLSAAQTTLNRLRQHYYQLEEDASAAADDIFLQEFSSCINADLNTSKALALIWAMLKSEQESSVKRANLDAVDQVFGLELASWQPQIESIPEQIQQMAMARQQARQNKDFALADQLRDQIQAAGYEIEDTPSGPKVLPM